MCKTLAALTLVLVATLVPVAGSGAAGGSSRIDVLEVENFATDRFVDRDHDQHPDAGDVLMGTSDLYWWAGGKRGARAGRLEVICTLAGEDAGHCQATAFLPAGSIQLQGYVNFASAVPRVAIVGGTGRYEGARGTFSSRHIGGEASGKSADTFSLLP